MDDALDVMLSISTGRSRMDTEWRRRTVSWRRLTEKLKDTRRTSESLEQYKSMNRTEKGKIKDVGGFVGGTLEGGQRKACAMLSRSLVTLDVDFAEASTLEDVRAKLSGLCWCMYSTHSHTEERPRFRLVMPLDREVTPDEYIPIARRLASCIGMDLFDDSTYQPERLMYWPSTPSDAPYVFEQGEGGLLDASAVLDSFDDWHDVSEWPVSSRVEKLASGRGGKQEDPLLKKGIVGAFCRTYSISEAIAAFLGDVYEPCGHSGRYTFIGGSTEAGAVVYDDRWLYSHHGTDPCCEREVNAFDLVRIHRFGDEDSAADPETQASRLPSFRRMEELALSDERVRLTLSRDNMAAAGEDFADVDPESDDSWKAGLVWRKDGSLEPSMRNLTLVLENDDAYRGALVTDVFRGGAKMLVRDLPGHRLDDPERGAHFTDDDYLEAVCYFSERYGVRQAKQTVIDALDLVASRHVVHPVREYLGSLPQWDGVKRLDSLLIDYLGADDDELTRAMTRKHFTAAVARILQPGTKHDEMLLLVGPQGIGKSTLCRRLAIRDEWFTDGIQADLNSKDTLGLLQGHLVVELAEFDRMLQQNTSGTVKQFVSKQEDTFRASYARSSRRYMRQCTFIGTTNEKALLRDTTGERRYWTVELGRRPASLDPFAISDGTVAQIWAEALVACRAGESTVLDSRQAEALKVRQLGFSEAAEDSNVGIVAEYLRRPLPCNWYDLDRCDRAGYFTHAVTPAADAGLRSRVCFREIQDERFGGKGRPGCPSNKQLHGIMEQLGLVRLDVDGAPVAVRGYGAQRNVYGITREFLEADAIEAGSSEYRITGCNDRQKLFTLARCEEGSISMAAEEPRTEAVRRLS